MSVAEIRAEGCIWQPQGWQWDFLSCMVPEQLVEGTRVAGKTEACLAKFNAYTGRGYGPMWRGICFRRQAVDLNDIKAKAMKLYSQLEPGPTYNQGDSVWTWPDGEQLLFRHMRTPTDYWQFHGWDVPFVWFDELTTWPTLECWDLTKSIVRANFKGPRFMIGTTNPKGKGHNVVKARFIDPAPPGKVVRVLDTLELPKIDDKTGVVVDGYEVKQIESVRVRHHADFRDNVIFLQSDPDYVARMLAGQDEATQKAWGAGDWEISSGGMFDDLYQRRTHCLPEFDVPEHWKFYRAMDWGSAKPFSIGWYAITDDTEIPVPADYPRPGRPTRDGKMISFVPGSIIRISEWYGWNGQPNQGAKLTPKQVAEGQQQREIDWGWKDRVEPGPADGIWNARESDRSRCHHDDFKARGIRYIKPSKGAGSRAQGWQQLRNMLEAAADPDSEDPGFFVFDEHCPQFVRTFPTQQRSDRDPDDIDTEGEDHLADEIRYLVLMKHGGASVSRADWR